MLTVVVTFTSAPGSTEPRRTNSEGEFVSANERAEAFLGVDPSDASGRTYNDNEWNITDTEGNPIPDEELPFYRVRESGEPVYGFEHTVEWPDGTNKTLLINGAPLFDDEGSVESAVFSLTDVTEKENAEARPQESIESGS